MSKALLAISLFAMVFWALIWGAYSAGSMHQNDTDYQAVKATREALSTELNALFPFDPSKDETYAYLSKRVHDISLRPWPEMRAQLAPLPSLRTAVFFFALLGSLFVAATVSFGTPKGDVSRPQSQPSD